MTRDGPIAVTVIHGHAAAIAGIRAWCSSSNPPIEVLAVGSDVDEAWTEPGRSADVVIFDLHLKGCSPAYRDLRRLVDDGRRVIVYTLWEDAEAALKCLDIGAFGYLTVAADSTHLLAATRAAAKGRHQSVPRARNRFPGREPRSRRPRLSPRETDVLLEWLQCDSKKVAAENLNLTPRTVNSYLDRIRTKYANAGRAAPTKAALVARAIQDGLISVDEL
jgi:DNA-binding NarL/FixJ family response regulator